MEKQLYKRNLPHWQPENAVFFITVRLKGSLPKEVVLSLQQDRELQYTQLKEQGLSDKELEEELRKSYDFYFGQFDDLLDSGSTGPHWLKNDTIAQIWINALNHFDHERYKVVCSTVEVMHSLKSFTANKANKILQQKGAFWQEESFDRVIRDRVEFEYRINYVLNNPVKAGIVSHWSDYTYNYIHLDFKKYIHPPP